MPKPNPGMPASSRVPQRRAAPTAYPGTNSSVTRFAQREAEKNKGDFASVGGGAPEQPGILSRIVSSVSDMMRGKNYAEDAGSVIKRQQAVRDSTDRARTDSIKTNIDRNGGYRGTFDPASRLSSTTRLPARYNLGQSGSTADLPPQANADRVKDSTNYSDYLKDLEKGIGGAVGR